MRRTAEWWHKEVIVPLSSLWSTPAAVVPSAFLIKTKLLAVPDEPSSKGQAKVPKISQTKSFFKLIQPFFILFGKSQSMGKLRTVVGDRLI
jgi:hypothetical protein